MITTSAKWFIGTAVVGAVLAAAYGWSTGGDGLGPVTMGYKGGVGDHLGYGVLVATAFMSALLGSVAVATRDADSEALAQVAGRPDMPAPDVPAGPAYWPAIAAFGVGLAAVGLVVSNVLFVGGLIVAGVSTLEWAVLTWADRATGDRSVNRDLRNQLMYPFEVPLLGALGVAALVASVSRILLASSADAAVWVAMGLAVSVLGLGTLVAVRPASSSNLAAAVLTGAALVTLVGGIVSGASGERTFHSLEEEKAHEASDHGGEAPNPPRVRIPGATGIGESSTGAGPVAPPTSQTTEEDAG